ncbi:UDP-glucosyltransferase 29 [Camellia lanceoleosa]|uniref:UDP-glucosyltransferase 29 n=1 Tax=Camellia lanceoleosa TaxID=1840588 RepID=A0ACC0IZB7_9ERIC|nr:UDP-glucosyltransferase 29 [Camellia lanceoleosa]
MDTKQSTINVLMLPWLAHGHISPFLELAKKLSHRNFHIYLCSTPINLKSIKNRITENYSHSIELVEIHLSSLPELPPHYHTTNGLPTHLNSTLLTAFDMAIPNVSNIFKTLSLDLVIYDINQAWVPTIASLFNIPVVQFMTTGTTVASYSIHFIKNHGGVEFPFPEIKLREFHEKQYRDTLLSAVNHPQNKQDTPVNGKPSCNILLFNTFRELEGKYNDCLSVINEKKVVPVGPLVQDIVDEIEHSEIMQWLDKKDESGVLFYCK